MWEVRPSITYTEQSFFLQVYQTLFISPLTYSLLKPKTGLEKSSTFDILMFYRKVVQAISKLILIFIYSFEDIPKPSVTKPQQDERQNHTFFLLN